MSATAIRDNRQTTLPQDVAEAAGLKPGDKADWRFGWTIDPADIADAVGEERDGM